MALFPKKYADFVARIRVPAGFVLVAAFGWAARPSSDSLAWGLPVAVAGLLLRGWAAGCLIKDERLATGGPYAWLRNPLYAGTVLVAAGFVIAARQAWLAVLFGAVFAFVYWPRIELEEQHLRDLFRAEFDAYAARVPMLLPRVPSERGNARFRWATYRRNEEYNALAGFVAGAAYLWWLTVR